MQKEIAMKPTGKKGRGIEELRMESAVGRATVWVVCEFAR